MHAGMKYTITFQPVQESLINEKKQTYKWNRAGEEPNQHNEYLFFKLVKKSIATKQPNCLLRGSQLISKNLARPLRDTPH